MFPRARSIIIAVISLGLWLGATPLQSAFAQAAVTPVLTSFNPNPITPGTAFTVHGSGFTQYGNKLVIDGGPSGYNAYFIASPDGTTLSASLATFMKPGIYQIKVTNGLYQTSNSLPITIEGRPAGFFIPGRTPSPSPAPPAAGSPPNSIQDASAVVTDTSNTFSLSTAIITIHGTGFQRFGNVVTMTGPGGEQKFFVASPDSQTLQFGVPPYLSPGAYTVTVKNSQGVVTHTLTISLSQSSSGSPNPNLPFPSSTPAVSPSPAIPQADYAALGDSLTVGGTALRPYPSRYRTYIMNDTGLSVHFTSLGQFGATSNQLLDALKTNQTFRSAIQEAEFVTWNIGGNDLQNARTQYQNRSCGGADNQDCLRQAASSLKTNWDQIISELSTLSQPNALLRTMDIYNPYVDEDKQKNTWPNDRGDDFQVMKSYFDEANRHIQGSRTTRDLRIAKVSEAFNGLSGEEDPQDKNYLSFDRVHPSDEGHQVIADRLRELGFGTISPLPPRVSSGSLSIFARAGDFVRAQLQTASSFLRS